MTMRDVAREWENAWRKTKINYDEDIRTMISADKEFMDVLKKYIRKNTLILEAGCGYGHKCIYFNNYGASVVGIDIVKKPLRVLNSYLKTRSNLQVFTVAGDVTKLPFRGNVFDVVTSFGVIEHFRKEEEVIETLKEASRVLRNDGFLVLSIPNFASTFRNKLVLALSRGRFGMYHKPYTPSILTRMFDLVRSLELVESGFTSFGFRKLILELTEKPSIEKLIYFLYHAVFGVLNILLKSIIHDDYLNHIYIVAKKAS